MTENSQLEEYNTFLKKLASIPPEKVTPELYKQFIILYGKFINNLIKRFSAQNQEIDKKQLYNDVQLSLLMNIHKIKILEHPVFLTYLKKTIKNRIIDQSRKKKEVTSFSADASFIPYIEKAYEQIDNQYFFEQLKMIIDSLPGKSREVIVKRFFEEKSIADTAIELQITPRAVFKRLLEAQKLLKEKLMESIPEIRDLVD